MFATTDGSGTRHLRRPHMRRAISALDDCLQHDDWLGVLEIWEECSLDIEKAILWLHMTSEEKRRFRLMQHEMRGTGSTTSSPSSRKQDEPMPTLPAP